MEKEELLYTQKYCGLLFLIWRYVNAFITNLYFLLVYELNSGLEKSKKLTSGSISKRSHGGSLTAPSEQIPVSQVPPTPPVAVHLNAFLWMPSVTTTHLQKTSGLRRINSSTDPEPNIQQHAFTNFELISNNAFTGIGIELGNTDTPVLTVYCTNGWKLLYGFTLNCQQLY